MRKQQPYPHQMFAIALLMLVLPDAALPITFFNQVVTKDSPPQTGCVQPAATNAFRISDRIIYLYFEAAVNSDDLITNDWLAPDGSTITGGNWNRLNGQFCFTGASLNLDPNTPRERFGSWRARVFNNGVVLFSVAFTLEPSSGPPPAQPSYEGYLDDVNCAKMWGWARDKNSGTPISVDILVDGSKLDTIRANEPRADLLGNYAFNYNLPATVKDGRQHELRVRFSDGRDLINSPKIFQNFCDASVITAPNSWRFDETTYGGALRGFRVVLSKKKMAGFDSQYAYTVYVFADALAQLESAHLATVTDERISVNRTLSDILVTDQNYDQFLRTPDSIWRFPPGDQAAGNLVAASARLYLGMYLGPVGDVADLGDILKNYYSRDSGSPGPSDHFRRKMENEDDNDTFRMMVTKVWYRNMQGAMFTVVVDESFGQPEFFVTARNQFNTVVGVEIGLDRRAIVFRR